MLVETAEDACDIVHERDTGTKIEEIVQIEKEKGYRFMG